jgi:hypothetical protein
VRRHARAAFTPISECLQADDMQWVRAPHMPLPFVTRPVLLASCLLSAASFAQTPAAPVPTPPDGTFHHGLGAVAAKVTTGTRSDAKATIGYHGMVALPDGRWRIGGRADWTRTATDAAPARREMRLSLVQESQHRVQRGTWLRQRIVLSPVVAGRGGTRTVVDGGVALAVTPKAEVNVGVTHRRESGAGTAGTAIGAKLDLRID